MQRSTSKRDKAIILTLLDTGLRAGELYALRVEDIDMKTGKIRIRPGDAGKAKGGKGRVVFMGKSVRRFLWRYLADQERTMDYSFLLWTVNLAIYLLFLANHGIDSSVNISGQAPQTCPQYCMHGTWWYAPD